MIRVPKRWRSQPGGARLVLDEYLESKNPLVASPYVAHVDAVNGGRRLTAGGGTGAPIGTVDRGVAYRMSGASNFDFWTYDGTGASGPYTNTTLTAWTIIGIARSLSGAGVQNCCVVGNGGFQLGLYIDNYAGPVAGAVTAGPGFCKSGITTSIAGDGRWHVVAGSYLASTYISYYLDGKLDAQNTTSIPSATSDTSTNTVHIGHSPDGVYFTGDILLAVVVKAALDPGYLLRATASVEDCWSTLFRPRRMVRSSFLPAGFVGGGGAVTHRWFLAA